jgi:hypothetical protein
MGDTSGNNDFYLDNLSFSMDAYKLTMPGGDDTVPITDVSCNAALECPYQFFQNILQFQTDAIDVDDLNVDDLEFRVFYDPSATDIPEGDVKYYNPKNLLIAEAVTYAGAMIFYGSATAHINEKKLGADYSRQVSLDAFGTTAGVDLFNNEREFRRNFLETSVTQFMNRLTELAETNANWNVESGDDATTYHPAKLAFQQILKNYPSRLTTLIQHSTQDPSDNDTKIWYKVPFQSGDKVYFRMSVNPDSTQGDIVGDELVPISSRTYLIRCDLVDGNNGITETSETAYTRIWDDVGPIWGTDPDYLQDPESGDTNAPSAGVGDDN